MKRILTFGLILISTILVAQTETKSEIIMTSDYGSDNSEIRDILQFEGIEYLKLSFSGKETRPKKIYELYIIKWA